MFENIIFRGDNFVESKIMMVCIEVPSKFGFLETNYEVFEMPNLICT